MALVPLASVDASALRWVRTRDRPGAFSLRAGDSEVATLRWERPGGSLATAEAAEGAWTLKRAGFLQPTVLVQPVGLAKVVARLSAHLSRHEITIDGGATYRLRHVSHLLPSWRLTNGQGEELFHLEPVAEKRTLSGGAVIGSRSPKDPVLALLLVLSWYFVVLTWLEDEAIDALAPFEGPDPPLARR